MVGALVSQPCGSGSYSEPGLISRTRHHVCCRFLPLVQGFFSSFLLFTKTKISNSNSIPINEDLLTGSSEFFRVSCVIEFFFSIFSQTRVIRKLTNANQGYNLIEVKISCAFYTANVVEFDNSQI